MHHLRNHRSPSFTALSHSLRLGRWAKINTPHPQPPPLKINPALGLITLKGFTSSHNRRRPRDRGEGSRKWLSSKEEKGMLGRERTRVAGEGLMTWWRRHAGSPDGNPPLCELLDETEARARFSGWFSSYLSFLLHSAGFFHYLEFLLSHSISRLSILSPLSSPLFSSLCFLYLSNISYLSLQSLMSLLQPDHPIEYICTHAVFLLSGWIFKLYLNDLSVLMETFESSVPSLRAKFIQSV